MARFEGSGRSRREFAAEAGIGLAIFQYWLYKLRREQQAMAVRKARVTEVRLVPVTVRGRPTARVRLELRVAGLSAAGASGHGPRICRAAGSGALLRAVRMCDDWKLVRVRFIDHCFYFFHRHLVLIASLRKLITDKAETPLVESATVVPAV
jgi:hypothetical protein